MSSPHPPSPCLHSRCRCEKLFVWLDLKEPLDDVRPLPSVDPTLPPLRDVFGVVGGDDLLARLGVGHDGVVVWEKPVEGVVEDRGGDEGVDVAYAESGGGVKIQL